MFWGFLVWFIFFETNTQALATKNNKKTHNFSVPSNPLPCLQEDLSKLSSVRLRGLPNHFFLVPPLQPHASVALA